MEIWKNIKGYEGLYQVSSEGRVKSLKRKGRKNERILKSVIDRDGYLQVALCAAGKQKTLKIHRLVCQAFHENPENKPEVNHINENKTDNRACNLEWSTRKENINHGSRTVRMAKKLAEIKSKPIAQYTLDGKLVKVWPSPTEVHRQLGISQGNISAVARG